MGQMRIFLSHSSQDKAFADALAAAFRQAGADVWYDEHSLGTGQLLDVIQHQLRERPVFVVILSKSAFASSWVRQECQWAWNLYSRRSGRVILPVAAEPLDPSDFDTMLYLEGFRRIHGCLMPEAVRRAVDLLGLKATHDGRAENVNATQLVVAGRSLAASREYTQVIAFCHEALRMEPGNREAWALLGYAQVMERHFTEAVAACERAIQIKRESTQVWNNKGVALSALRRYADAITAYKAALDVTTQFKVAWWNMAYAFRALGFGNEAREAEQTAIDQGYRPGARNTYAMDRPVCVVCHNCGAAMRSDAHFCNQCGSRPHSDLLDH